MGQRLDLTDLVAVVVDRYRDERLDRAFLVDPSPDLALMGFVGGPV
jgi:hypothetical protein